MDHHDRARLIQHKQRATLHEAAYLVTTSLGGTWDDAVSLLVDWVQTNRLLADVVPRIDPWSGKETAPIDPSKATVTVADLKALLETMTTRTGDVISDIGPQHVADMAEISNNGKCIDWVYWAGKMPRWSVAHAVRLMAALDPESFPDLSLKRNDSAGAAKEHARRLERLATAHHMAEATPAEWLQWADGLNESVHIGMRLAVERQRGIGGAPADGYELRYQAIGEDARFALFNVAELAVWASANKVAIPFLKLLVTDEHPDVPPERRFQPCGTLPLLIATAYVPADMDPHEAKAELLASGDAADDGDPVGRLRGRIAASYERQLLNAVYDGKLTVYGRTDYAPIDLTAARLRWEEKSTVRTRQQTHGNAITTPPGVPAKPGATDAAWKTRARELAQEFGEAKWARGEREITARNICRVVAKELGKKPEFHGNRGPRSESNVRNEALKGWKFSPPPRQDLNGSNGLSRSCGKFKPASNRRNPIAARRSSLRRFSCLLSKKARKSKNLILPIVHRDALRFSPIPAHIGAAGIARNRVRSGVYGVSHGHADLQSFPPHAARVADHR